MPSLVQIMNLKPNNEMQLKFLSTVLPEIRSHLVVNQKSPEDQEVVKNILKIVSEISGTKIKE